MEGHRMTNEIAGRAGKTERVLYLDCLRILSIAAMMLLHISAQNWSSLDLHDPAWMLFDILNGATRWCVPVFLMISGVLFLNPLRPISTKKLLLHNVLRVVTAFLFWACVYGFWNFRNGEPAKEAFLSIFSGHYHMWFLFLIVGLYFVSPLLRCVVGNAQVLKYYLLCFAALDFAIPWLMDCLLLVRIPHTVDALTAIRLAYDRLIGYLPSENVFYFVLGSYLASKEIPKKNRVMLYIAGVIGYIGTVLLTRRQSLLNAFLDLTFLRNGSVNVFLMSAAVFVFGKYGMSRRNPGEGLRRAVVYVSQCCFGMYLVHALIIEALNEKFGLNTLTFQPLIAALLILAITFIGSLIISAILNRIPILKKYIV